MDAAGINQLVQNGLNCHLAGQVAEAEKLYRRTLEMAPQHADALHLLGVLVAQRGEYEPALALLGRAVTVLPTVAEFHRHLADTLALAGRHELALESYRRAIQINASDLGSYIGASRTLATLSRNEEAIEYLQRAVCLAPHNVPALTDLGVLLARTGRFGDAVSFLQRAVSLKPDFAEAWPSLADALLRVGRYEESREAGRRGIELAPQDTWARMAYGNSLQVTADFQGAAEQYRELLRIDPNYADAQNNLGLTLLKMGEAQEARRIFDEGVGRWPDHIDLRANRSLAILTLGELELGFKEYESRWLSGPFKNAPRPAQPRWDGSDLGGKTILLTSEQGSGDTIQFIRYAKLVRDRGGRVLVSCNAELKSLLETAPGVDQVFAYGSGAPPEMDVYAPMASLPFLLGTTLETIPADVPYLKADPARVEKWREKLAGGDELKVGIAWAGSPAHQNDRARTCRLEEFSILAKIEGTRFFSLQKGEAARALAGSNLPIIPLGDDLIDFAETAALLEVLDLVISIDTAVVHVAGALARPVWTLLARGPDWRWMLEREDTPWYPTMRLFRQHELGQWGPVFQRVAEELRLLVSGG
jgi:tetratricopeptide (TPR) repeat protein